MDTPYHTIPPVRCLYYTVRGTRNERVGFLITPNRARVLVPPYPVRERLIIRRFAAKRTTDERGGKTKKKNTAGIAIGAAEQMKEGFDPFWPTLRTYGWDLARASIPASAPAWLLPGATPARGGVLRAATAPGEVVSAPSARNDKSRWN